MTRTKKILSLAVALTLTACVVLSGCGGKGGTKTGEVSTSQKAAKEELKPVELTWYYNGSSPGKDQPVVEEEINKYLKDKINATIKFYGLGWDEFKTKTSAMSAANEAFDIVFSPVWMGFNENLNKNMYLDITEMFSKYCPETKKLIGDDFLKGGMVDGKLYAIPTNKEKAHAYGFVFNKALVDKYNLDINSIKSAKDIEPMLKVIKEKEPGVLPLFLSAAGSLTHLLDIDPVTGDDTIAIGARNGETKLMMTLEMPEVVEAYKLTRDFYLKEYISKDAATSNGKAMDALKKEGKVFAYIVNTIPGRAAALSNDKVTWVQKTLTKPLIGNKDLGGSMNSISRTSKNPERALMFLELVNTDTKLNNLIGYGVENKHFTKVSDNVIKLIPDSGYKHTNQWVFGNQFINYLTDKENPKKWEEFDKFNKEATTEKSLGFTFTKWDDVKTEVAAVKLALSETYFHYGIHDLDKDLPKAIDKVKKAGFDKVVQAIQNEYDAWLAKNKK